MQVDELLPYLRQHRDELIEQLRRGKYKPNPVRRVEIPKEEKGKVRKLGIPSCVDRMIQQAISQELTPIFEEQFSDNSFGFRPGRRHGYRRSGRGCFSDGLHNSSRKRDCGSHRADHRGYKACF